MPAKQKPAPPAVSTDLPSALAWLERHATKKTRDGMARYGLPSDKALGVTVADIQALGKLLGRSHALAAELFATDVFEARMLAAFVDEPELVTAAQMERWARSFDNWGICDTLCFKLFDQARERWKMVEAWSERKEEFVRRAAFALLWSLTRHDKEASDAKFLHGLELIERGAFDPRPLVHKAVNMALRATGKRNPALRRAACATAARLAASPDAAARWVGKDALRELQGKKPSAKKKGA